MASQPCWWADRINVAAIDAFRGYASAIGHVLPAATLVIDHFHGPLADIGGAGAFIPSAELRLRHPSGRLPIWRKRRKDAAPASSKPVEDGRVELEVYPETRVRLQA